MRTEGRVFREKNGNLWLESATDSEDKSPYKVAYLVASGIPKFRFTFEYEFLDEIMGDI